MSHVICIVCHRRAPWLPVTSNKPSSNTISLIRSCVTKQRMDPKKNTCCKKRCFERLVPFQAQIIARAEMLMNSKNPEELLKFAFLGDKTGTGDFNHRCGKWCDVCSDSVGIIIAAAAPNTCTDTRVFCIHAMDSLCFIGIPFASSVRNEYSASYAIRFHERWVAICTSVRMNQATGTTLPCMYFLYHAPETITSVAHIRRERITSEDLHMQYSLQHMKTCSPHAYCVVWCSPVKSLCIHYTLSSHIFHFSGPAFLTNQLHGHALLSIPSVINTFVIMLHRILFCLYCMNTDKH